MMDSSLLRFDQVRFGYGERTLFAGVSFGVATGEAVAILGRNGVGKTTLLNLALGWLRPWQGSVLLNGRMVRDYPRSETGRQMSLVPQVEQIAFDYTVHEYVLFGRAPYLKPLSVPSPADQAIAIGALEQVGLADRADEWVTHLSGGEAQLVLLARALAQEPAILLLDEPSSHLDIHNTARLLKRLRELKAGGTAMLFTTHDPMLAGAIADRVVLVEPGRVAFVGAPEQAITSARMSDLYQTPVEVFHDRDGLFLRWHASGPVD